MGGGEKTHCISLKERAGSKKINITAFTNEAY